MNMDMNTMQEKLSAMMDNEWDDQEIDALLAEIDEDESACAAWHDYHLISDTMNERAQLSSDFMTRFSEKLAAEPTVLAPRALKRRAAARAAKRPWLAISVAASVALMSATALYVGHPVSMSTAQPELLASNQTVLPKAAVENESNPYMMAHQDLLGNPGFTHRAVILTGAEAEHAVSH